MRPIFPVVKGDIKHKRPSSQSECFGINVHLPLPCWPALTPTILSPLVPAAQLGCVAWPDAEEPPLGLVRCMRRDLVTPSRVLEPPLWSGASSENQFWRCTLWSIDNPAHTFLAVKATPDQRPNPQLARTAVY